MKPDNLISLFKKKYEDDFHAALTHSGLIAFLNPNSYLLARGHIDTFRKIDHIYFDGITLVNLFRLFKIVKCRRMGPDMAGILPKVFSYAQEKDKSIFFIGTKPGIIDLAVMNIKKKYSHLKISGWRHGYFSDKNEWQAIINQICKLKPDIVLTGMGTPLQDRFLVDLKRKGWSGLGLTCGGFFHQTAKKLKYYPDWMTKFYLNWLYRLYDEPKLIGRYLIKYPIFLGLFFIDLFDYKLMSLETA